MAYNNIFDWHDSARKRFEQEQKAYSQDFVDIYQKWAQKHKEELKTIWDTPKNPANEAWERQSKIKRDPNDIALLCKVEIIN